MNSPPDATRPKPRSRFGTARLFALVLGIAATIAGAEFYALYRSRQANELPPPAPAQTIADSSPPAAPASAPAPPRRDPPIGAIDMPGGEAVVGPRITISGWALAAAGLRAVELRSTGVTLTAAIGIPRPDVAAAKPGYPDAGSGGFEFTGDLSSHPAAPGDDRRVFAVVAIAKDGAETILGTRSVIDPAALVRWRDLVARGPAFHLLPALSGVALGGAHGLDTEYTPYLSPTTRIGMRVPILYMRTTRGPALRLRIRSGVGHRAPLQRAADRRGFARCDARPRQGDRPSGPDHAERRHLGRRRLRRARSGTSTTGSKPSRATASGTRRTR